MRRAKRLDHRGLGRLGRPRLDQTFAYVADGVNQQVHVLRRKPLEYLYSFGSGGRMAGQFFGVRGARVQEAHAAGR